MNPRLLSVALAALAAAGCNYVPRIPGVTPYRMEIQQGNYVSQDMVSQLRPGMTKEQACTKAKTDVQTMAKRLCETIVHNGGYRNAQWTVSDVPCDCNQPNARVTVCIADLPYSCRWEMQVSEHVEICG